MTDHFADVGSRFQGAKRQLFALQREPGVRVSASATTDENEATDFMQPQFHQMASVDVCDERRKTETAVGDDHWAGMYLAGIARHM